MAKPYTFVHDGVAYTFSTKPEKAEHKSQLAGRPVFIDQEICTARIPSLGAPKQANSDTITQDWLDYKDGVGRTDHPLTVFRDHYDRWKAGMENKATGTPLREHADLTDAMIMSLEASKVVTLEALAVMDPKALAAVLGPRSREIVERAKELIAPPDKNVQALREKNAKMENDMEALKAQIAALQEARAADQKPAPKGKAAKDEAAA